MNLNDYQKLAMVTRNTDLTKNEALMNAALGLNGEAGEFADVLKKHMFQGHDLDVNHLLAEVGDILWYCALAVSVLEKTLDEAAVKNITKLKQRYPEGFDALKSINRDLSIK